eukprot:scaffold132540_cov22-Tisochrysis_lutea.AAC.2
MELSLGKAGNVADTICVSAWRIFMLASRPNGLRSFKAFFTTMRNPRGAVAEARARSARWTAHMARARAGSWWRTRVARRIASTSFRNSSFLARKRSGVVKSTSWQKSGTPQSFNEKNSGLRPRARASTISKFAKMSVATSAAPLARASV